MTNKKHIIHNTQYRILVTGGGSGGHVMPLEAVVEELKIHHYEMLYVGSGIPLEKEMAARQSLAYQAVFSGKYRRYFSWHNLIDPFKILIGFFQSLVIILSFKPNVVFAKGGYVTLPVVLAAWVLAKPIIIHESDAVMGSANRWGSKLARKICVGFPVEYYHGVPLDKIIYTGNPVRKQFNNLAMKQFSNKTQLPTILITGGSQGARFINQIIAAISPKLTEKYHIIHISGKNDYGWLVKNKWSNYELYDFTNKIPELMKKADLVISRAGANAIAELANLAKPSILIPLPSAASNHQNANTTILEKNNAAVVLRENSLTAESLLDIINLLLSDKKMLADLSTQIKKFVQPESASTIAQEISQLIKK